jgi:hypothetical protein
MIHIVCAIRNKPGSWAFISRKETIVYTPNVILVYCMYKTKEPSLQICSYGVGSSLMSGFPLPRYVVQHSVLELKAQRLMKQIIFRIRSATNVQTVTRQQRPSPSQTHIHAGRKAGDNLTSHRSHRVILVNAFYSLHASSSPIHQKHQASPASLKEPKYANYPTIGWALRAWGGKSQWRRNKRHKQSLYHEDDDAELLSGFHDGEVIRSVQVVDRETKEIH